MNANRKFWNDQQQVLQDALARPTDHRQTLALALSQHAMVHAASMSEAGLWSFEDEVWDDMSERAARCVPPKLEHSVVWVFWHIARIEDVTMNLLVAGGRQVFDSDDWQERIKSPIRHTGNAMSEADVQALSTAVDIEALRAYRTAVGRRTRQIVQQLQPDDLRRKIESARLQQIWEQGAVLEAAGDIVAYWSKRTVAGLLLMPATRHNFLHLNEALRLKQKCRSSES